MNLKILIDKLGTFKKDTILTPIYSAGEVFMEILIPFVTASIIDKGIETGNMRNVYLYGGLMVVFALLSLFCAVQAGMHAASASSGFARNIRLALFEKVQTFSFANIDKFSTAGLITRMTSDVTNLQNAFQMCIRIAVRSPLMLISSIVMSFVVNARLSLIFVAVLIFLGIGLFAIIKISMPMFLKVFDSYDDLNASVQENVSAIRTVKAFDRADYENKKFSKAVKLLSDLSIRAESLLAFNNPMMMFAVDFCIVCLSWFGAHYIVGGSLTTGNLASLFSYVMSMLMSLMMLSMIFVMLSMSTASVRRISDVLSEQSDITNPKNAVTEIADGSVDFNNVSFSYRKGSGSYVLSGIECHIKPGETIGIIGATGSGKSTLVSLISRLYDVTEGAVFVGGCDVRSYDIETLRNAVAVVLQRNVLFSGTILDNLRWGNEHATEKECRIACMHACADEFIERFPDKYNTYIEQGGTNVSGGQRQRLCIARALLKNPKILILDDSTSAVDTATDAKIRRFFRERLPDMTKIIISQRISSVQDADRIMVLEGGKISGFDTHENLLLTNAIYREIAEMQGDAGGDFDIKAE